MDKTLTPDPPPYVEPKPIFECRQYVQGDQAIHGLVPINGGQEIFMVSISFSSFGQTGHAQFPIEAANVEEAFEKLPAALEEAKQKIESQARQNMLMAGPNDQAAKRMAQGTARLRNRFNGG